MLLTYPPPFFCCRELIIISLPKKAEKNTNLEENVGAAVDFGEGTALLVWKKQHLEIEECDQPGFLLPGDDRQLKQPYHIMLTVALWGVTVLLALFAPSLGDVINLVGCMAGTIIAFILPALFAFRIEGYTHTALVLLVLGGAVGVVGTYFSLVELINDL